MRPPGGMRPPTLSNPVYTYTGATLDPLQCVHSVHCSVCPVHTLTDTSTVSGLLHIKKEFHYQCCYVLPWFIITPSFMTTLALYGIKLLKTREFRTLLIMIFL